MIKVFATSKFKNVELIFYRIMKRTSAKDQYHTQKKLQVITHITIRTVVVHHTFLKSSYSSIQSVYTSSFSFSSSSSLLSDFLSSPNKSPSDCEIFNEI